MGNCPHRKYIPRLIELVPERQVDPPKVLTEVEPMTDAIAAYKAFDQRQARLGEGRAQARGLKVPR